MATQNDNRVSIGDRVRFSLGTSCILGVVVEDRGPIGARSARIFRVRVSNDPYDDKVFEMPEDEIDVVGQDAWQGEAIHAGEAMEYLERGGLIRILRAGMSGGKTQPRAWLCRDSLGNATHTFSPDRGVLGGAIVPFSALHDNRVFTPKRDDVLSFLNAFELSSKDSEHVLQTVGMAP